MDLTIIVRLIFPALLALAGTYLIVRGSGRLFSQSTARSVFCSKVKGKNNLVSPIFSHPCVYYSLTVECQTGSKWRRLARETSEYPFLLGDRTIIPKVAFLSLTNPYVTYGRLQGQKGLVRKGIRMLNDAALRPYAMLTGVWTRHPFDKTKAPEYGYLEDSLWKKLSSYPDFKKQMEGNTDKLFRITESILTSSMEICVIAEAGQAEAQTITGTVEFPLILSDMKPDDAHQSLRERGLVSVFLGIGLFCVSAVLTILTLIVP